MELNKMFRKMRRYKQELSFDECEKVLVSEPRGVLAVHGENGYPYALPMNFIYLNGRLYFHSAKEGHKLEAIAKNDKVSFCVMDKGFRKDGQWPLNIRSVVVFGRIARLDDTKNAEAILRRLGLKYYPSAGEVEAEISKSMKNADILELTIDHMTGKLVNES